ncbi:hypothetical protein [Haloarcula salina]|uniref:hypothetical protein n=1 Tax=Haloarcula salina TaxID=1429914 RepID=UPI001F50ACE3|nr:hypothetical protein [Haloarcula salina]
MDDPLPDIILQPGLDRVFEALFTRRRRLILFMLKRSDPRPVVDFLPRSAKASESTSMQLQQDDLPRLASLGYIDWDREAGEVSKGDRFEELEPMLDLLEDHADEFHASWSNGRR